MLRKLFRAAKSKKITFVAGLTMALTMALGLGAFGTAQVFAAQDCDNNAVIYCGFSNATDFINKVQANHSHPGSSPDYQDLQAIYKAAGLEASDYQNFKDHARPGYVFRDGHIEIDGQTVATNVKTFGRFQSYHTGTGYEAWPIPGTGTTLHGNTPTRSFASGVQKIPALAIFDAKGVLKFVVITSCGNTTKYTPVVPKYECKELHADHVSDGKYNFWTDASAYDNASIAYVEYDFGDGKKEKVTTPGANNTYPTSHTYAESKGYTAKVTVFVKLPGDQTTFITPAGGCIKQIVVPQYECLELGGVFLDKDRTKLKVKFTATANYAGDGVKFDSADFYFGDDGNNPGATGVKPNADGKTATAEHTYTFAEDSATTIKYSAKAVLHFTVDGKAVVADACPAVVTYEKSVSECKPGIPVGDARCTPCPYDSSLPKGDIKCVPPELPNTGAGNTIAIFSAVVIGGFLVYRQLLFRKHRAAFNAAQNGTSPLPLGDPLNDQNPLQGTPLETQVHRSFRRKRHF